MLCKKRLPSIIDRSLRGCQQRTDMFFAGITCIASMHDEGFINLFDKLMLCFFVIRLRRIAQLLTRIRCFLYCNLYLPFLFRVLGFFLMLMSSCFSALFIIVSKASPRSFKNASCFSAMQFSGAAILFEYPTHPEHVSSAFSS